ncbi:MAG: glycoside hydrolase family 19 protein [Coleofasciculus sp.]
MSCTSGSAYAIKPGDTLYLIAQRELGNGDRWREIMKPDGIPYTEAEASNLQAGQEICLPNGSVPQPPSPPPPPSSQLQLQATFYSREQSTHPDGTVQPPATGEFGKTLTEALAGQGFLQCAVDPNVIPLKTVFTLILWDGQQVSAKALDIGTAIKGNKIDIYVDTNTEAINLGVQSVTALLGSGSGNGNNNGSTGQQIALQTYNGQYVGVEENGARPVVANRTTVGNGETFTLHELGGNQIALQAPNGQYVSAEDGGGRELVANRSSIDAWETFTLHQLGGNQIALQAHNGQYVCAEDGGGRELVANRNSISGWEVFVKIKPGTVPPPPPSGGGFASIVSRQTYDAMFPNRNDLYSYDNLVAATQKYPEFCNRGADEQRKREAAAFLANIAHETTGGWDTAPGGPYAWGLHFTEEVGCEHGGCTQYCDPSNTRYPCVPGKTYHGRGPMQLSWNYNYGQVGEALGINLLANPDLVKTDGAIAFQTALWFWMTPQPPKPSGHAVMTGGWTPNPSDISQGRAPGFGMTINIINGKLEGCGEATSPQVEDRVGFYQRFCEMLGVSMGDNIYCDRMAHY